jgi:hypothetical protein
MFHLPISVFLTNQKPYGLKLLVMSLQFGKGWKWYIHEVLTHEAP